MLNLFWETRIYFHFLASNDAEMLQVTEIFLVATPTLESCIINIMTADDVDAIRDKLILTHLPLVPHICINESGQNWFR